jgi:hypothetical protein
VKKWFFSFRGFLVFILSGSLLLTPVIPAYAREHGIPLPPGFVPGPGGIPVPGGIPMPGGIPAPPGVSVSVGVPVPGPPIGVERRYHPNRSSRHWDRRPARYDGRDYRQSRQDWRPRPHGSVFRSLPADIFALHVAGAAFFYHMGTYYRHTPSGYVVVEAPFGARVRSLPESCSTLYLDGRRYYDCDDVYYEPDGDDYVVIERPSGHYYPEVEVGDEVRVRAESLNVRSGAGTRYRVVSKLYHGDIVEVGGMEGDWYYVRLSNGLNGWIMREHTRLHRGRQDVKG